jgi:hypothetical protein
MALTEQQQKLVDYLRTSLRLQSPEMETDPAYAFTDDDLWAILEIVTPVHSPADTIETIPSSEMMFVMMLARKEVFYRLATSTAPFYPLSAEGAELQKNVRFDHYLALIKVINEEYEALTGKDGGDTATATGVIETFESTVQGNHYTVRNYNAAIKPTVDLQVNAVTSTTADLDWTKFDRGLFSSYHVYADTSPIIDEYADKPLRTDIESLFHSTDIHRQKLRVSNLIPDTEYYFCVVSKDRNGLYGFSQIAARTLPLT